MTYLDNAATTYPKPGCVYRRLQWCLHHAAGNPGRSSHAAALAAAEEIYATREALARLLCFQNPERIVFTQNATYALNMAIHAVCPHPRHVIFSDREHNSVIRPIAARKEKGCDYSIFSTDGEILASMEAAMRPETELCVLSLCSNVTGECFPLSTLLEFRKRHPSVRVILDGSQWLGHLPFSLSESLCDVLCAPGHKALFGLQGSGFAAFSREGGYTPFAYGGSGSDSENPDMPRLLPERLEAGTLATPAISALGAGVRFLLKEGLDAVSEKIFALTKDLYERLHSLRHAEVLSENGVGIVSFIMKGMPASSVTAFLDTHGICVRSGLHCAPLIHQAKRAPQDGSVRASVSYLNKKRDIDSLYRALRKFEAIHY